jgi:putative sterol carrier protein
MSQTSTNQLSTVPLLFDHIVAGGEVPSLRRASGVYEFDIDQGGGRWFLKLDHGRPSLQQHVDKPDCAIECSLSDFIDVAEGRQNMMTAFLQGRIKFTGDAALALDFRRLLPVAA